MADRTKTLIVILVAIIVVLIAVLVYVFLIQPTIQGYVVNQQTQGAQSLYLDIVRVVTQCQQYTLPIGNQTIHLIAVECLQQQQQQVQQKPAQ